MNPRRSATALAGAAVLCLTAIPMASADGNGQLPPGLYGEQDPEYTGVMRQSLTLLAQDVAGYTPAAEAVDWLVGQQCADGSFEAYRADPSVACGDVTGADTNATAHAVQALAVVDGQEEAVVSATNWLESVQNQDGGWGFNPGMASDANSTALIMGALAATGADPAQTVRDKNSPYEALASLQLGCDATEPERGAFAWQHDEEWGLIASHAATVDAVLAGYGSGLAVAPDAGGEDGAVPVSPLRCDDDEGAEDADAEETPVSEPQPGREAAQAGAAYLVGTMEENGGYLISPEAGPDHGATALTVLALSAGGHEVEREVPLEWLRENHTEWVGYEQSPAALGYLVLAAHAGGADPADFGGSNLIGQLNDLGPEPKAQRDAATDGADSETDGDDSGSAATLLWVLGIALLVGIGIGVILSLRGKRGRNGQGSGPEQGGTDSTDSTDSEPGPGQGS